MEAMKTGFVIELIGSSIGELRVAYLHKIFPRGCSTQRGSKVTPFKAKNTVS